MTVNSTIITSGPYVGNDVSDTFSYNFRITDKTQLKVFETDTNGLRVLLTVDTDYTVAGINDDNGGPITRVAGPLPLNYEWYIRSDYKLTQLTAVPSQGPFLPVIHENVFDKLTFLIQQLNDIDTRTFRISDAIDVDGIFELNDDAISRASNFLAFDINGDLTLAAGVTNVIVSPFMGLVNAAENAFDATGILKSGYVVSNKSEALSLANLVNGRKVFITSSDGGSFTMRTGLPIGTLNDDSILFSGTKFTNGDGSSGIQRDYSGVINSAFFGVLSSAVDNSTSFQEAINTGFNVFTNAGSYTILTGLTQVAEGQIFYGEGNATKIIAGTLNMSMFTMTTQRHQKVRDILFDGNSLADYGIVMDFPKVSVSNAQVEGCLEAGIWMGYFSLIIDNNTRVQNNAGHGILVQDKTGQVNDIRIRDVQISSNAKHGIFVNTTSRDGFFISGCNMEENGATAGFSHIKFVNVRGIYISDMYHENSLDIAGKWFYDFDSSINSLSLNNIKMSDGSSTTKMNYFIRVGTTGGNTLESARFSDLWAFGYGQKMIESNLNTSVFNSLTLENIHLRHSGGTANDYASSGNGLTLLPARNGLVAKLITAQQDISTIETVIFNQAFESTTQSDIDAEMAPEQYSITTGIYTCFEPGRYKVSGTINLTAPASNVYAVIDIHRSGSNVSGSIYSESGNGVKNVTGSFDYTFEVQSGQTIEVKVTSSSGTIAVRQVGTNLSITKVASFTGQQ